MILTKTDFDQELTGNRLRIALIGMSNSGKSTTTSALVREAAFDKFEVDEAINSVLALESMDVAAQWMGYPFDDRYQSRKQTYLELEEKFTKAKIPGRQNFVLDTTGSVIYLTSDLHDWIKENFLVVALEVSAEMIEQLVTDYFSQPKTVIWGNEFQQGPNEAGKDALRRCYPQLLANRSIDYRNLGDIQIPATVARSADLTADKFLAAVRDQLPTSTEL